MRNIGSYATANITLGAAHGIVIMLSFTEQFALGIVTFGIAVVIPEVSDRSSCSADVTFGIAIVVK